MFDPTTVTVADFKAQFFRGFNYLPVWEDTTTYNSGDLIFYEINQHFYTCTVDGTIGTAPTDPTKWVLTPGYDKYDYVWDEDITEAFAEAIVVFNLKMRGTDAQLQLMYLYLTAHYLVLDIRAQGLQSGMQGIVGGRSVGNVSENYVIPEWMQKPYYSFYITTFYGFKYLNLTLPNRVGRVSVISGNGPYTIPIGCNPYNRYF